MKKTKKISIVGNGIGGISTAIALDIYGKFFDIIDNNEKIEVYYDPSIKIEKVGQGTTLDVFQNLSSCISSDWNFNIIKATPKTGIMYEGWGKKNDKIFHSFTQDSVSAHYDPSVVGEILFNSPKFKLIEKNISSINDIDSDYIFDCRGKHLNNLDNYKKLVNPLNSVICHRKNGRDYTLNYTRTVATPDGWCFVIPTTDYVSYGYLYNNTITSKEEASENFAKLFDAKVDFSLNFDNYVAKNIWESDRVILNGNRYAFIEPMEATSSSIYFTLAKQALAVIDGKQSKQDMQTVMSSQINEIEMFILWHYQFGSKYDTPFWKYAKSLPFKTNEKFESFVKYSRENDYTTLIRNKLFNYPEIDFGPWPPNSFKQWIDGVE